MALVTEVCVGAMEWRLTTFIFESRNGDDRRTSQLREVLDDAGQREQQRPVIIGGDFNFEVARRPQSVAISDSGFKNLFIGKSQPTIVNSDRRGRTLDCILMRGGFNSMTAGVHVDIRASDHYPLCLAVFLDKSESSAVL